MNDSSFVSPKRASLHYNVSKETLRQWANSKKIKFITTSGGHRRYEIKTITVSKASPQVILYARVSSRKQKADLRRQISFLKHNIPKYNKIITDISSGLNYERSGFQRILESVYSGNIQTVYVSTKDRFVRFGFDHFKWTFELFGSKLINLDGDTKCKTKELELAEDIISIITVFSAKYHGSRNYTIYKENKDKEIKQKSV